MTESSRFKYLPHIEEKIKSECDPVSVDDSYEEFCQIKQTVSGMIYRARSKKTGKDVAIKFVRDDAIEIDYVRALQEFDILKKQLRGVESPFLLVAENIVYDEERGFGIVTPWAEYGDLAQGVGNFSNDGEAVASLGMQLGLGLAELHSRDIIHRDLKPENIFVERHEKNKKFKRYQIGDYGISATLEYLKRAKTRRDHISQDELATDFDVWGERLTPSNVTMGTVSYMSPEQVVGESFLTAKSDIFAVGIILYEAIAGVNPFKEDGVIDTMLNIRRGTLNGINYFRLKRFKGITEEQEKKLKDIVTSILIVLVDKRGQRRLGLKIETASDLARAFADIWDKDGGAEITNTREFIMASQL